MPNLSLPIITLVGCGTINLTLLTAVLGFVRIQNREIKWNGNILAEYNLMNHCKRTKAGLDAFLSFFCFQIVSWSVLSLSPVLSSLLPYFCIFLLSASSLLIFPLSLSLPTEKPRAVPWQQNDPHPAGLPGRELPHHHVHLLLSLQLQRRRDQVDSDVWTAVDTPVDAFDASLHNREQTQFHRFFTCCHVFQQRAKTDFSPKKEGNELFMLWPKIQTRQMLTDAAHLTSHIVNLWNSH